MSKTKQSTKVAGEKLRDADKLAYIPVKIIEQDKKAVLRNPIGYALSYPVQVPR